jgi:hypothetical protein
VPTIGASTGVPRRGGSTAAEAGAAPTGSALGGAGGAGGGSGFLEKLDELFYLSNIH